MQLGPWAWIRSLGAQVTHNNSKANLFIWLSLSSLQQLALGLFWKILAFLSAATCWQI